MAKRSDQEDVQLQFELHLPQVKSLVPPLKSADVLRFPTNKALATQDRQRIEALSVVLEYAKSLKRQIKFEE